jgi:hypothetical protein
MKTYFVTLFSLVMTLVACGSSSSGSGSTTDNSGTAPAGTCESAGTRICERACACSTDGKCHVATKMDGGSNAAISFDNKEQCLNLYVTFGCLGGGTAGFPYGTCESEVNAAACAPSAGGTGVLLPESCKPAK